MKRSKLILTALLPVGFVGVTYPHFRNSMRCGRERLLTGGHTVATEFGDIEYAVRGSGPPVLLLHGAGGGYDQGLIIGEFYVGNHNHVIAPSRFGYIRSSIPENGSPATQADAYAALLDTLGVERVAVVAFSDGGPSALQFTIRHSDRCAALVMISATRVPDAEFISYKQGGHLLVLQLDDVREKVAAFLRIYGSK